MAAGGYANSPLWRAVELQGPGPHAPEIVELQGPGPHAPEICARRLVEYGDAMEPGE